MIYPNVIGLSDYQTKVPNKPLSGMEWIFVLLLLYKIDATTQLNKRNGVDFCA